jgi:DNA (cytosine-5)-methyltransferase 1
MNVLDLFCGCGGMSKGLKDAGFNIVASVDIWDKAIENYRKNFNHLAVCEDLTKLSPKDFETKYIKNKKIDILVGGPPCQGFSIAGKRDLNDPRNSLFMEYVKYLDHFNPKCFIMENVVGILSMKSEGSTKVIDIIMSYLEKNYVCKICKLCASDFGVPQNRKRVIIIGIRKDLGIVPTEPLPINSVENRPTVKKILIPRKDIDKSYFLSERAIEGIIKEKRKIYHE